MRTAQVTTTIHREELMVALRTMTIHNKDFDYRQWSIWDVEVLDQIARMIREGYSAGSPPR